MKKHALSEGVVTAGEVAIGTVLLIGALVVVTAWPTMLVLGALHLSHGMSRVPALGFWQTYGSLFVIGSVGQAFRSSKSEKS